MRLPAPIRFALLLMFAACGFAAGGVAFAQGTALYEGEAPVADQSEAERNAALPRALAQVLAKVTGAVDAGSDPTYAALLRRAPELVRQYRYREDVATAGGIPVVRLHLVATFDRAAVDAAVASAGGTVWPQPRPRPLLWLAIDDGRGPRLLGESQSGAVVSLTRRAADRGLSFGVPLADTQDQTRAGAQAVWNEDLDAIRTAAARYGSDPILVGRLQRGAALWNVQWILLDGAGELARWNAVNADVAPLLSGGADSAIDALARHYARAIATGEAGDYEVRVEGLSSAGDYARLLGYLRSLAVVRDVVPLTASGDAVQLRLSLTTDVTGLARLVRAGGPLRAEEGGGDPQFRWEP